MEANEVKGYYAKVAELNQPTLTIEEREYWFEFTRKFFDNILSKVNDRNTISCQTE